MNQLTQEDYKNILALISRANITGQEATSVAILQQKLAKLLQPDAQEETKPNKGKQDN